MPPKVFVTTIIGLLILCCTSCQQPQKPAPTINYKNSSELDRLSAPELASLVQTILSDQENRERFLSTDQASGTTYHWTHNSNGALWQSLFSESRKDEDTEVLKAFVSISNSIIEAIEKPDGKPWKERSNGVFALALGFSRCKAFLEKRPDLQKRFMEPISLSLKEFSSMAESEQNFDAKLEKTKKRLVTLSDALKTKAH